MHQFVTTFGADANKTEPLDVYEDFKGPDLLEQRQLALKNYKQKLKGFKTATFFLPFASPKDFVKGRNAPFSIYMSFVEYYSDDDYQEYYLFGGSDEDRAEASDFEQLVFSEMGLMIY